MFSTYPLPCPPPPLSVLHLTPPLLPASPPCLLPAYLPKPHALICGYYWRFGQHLEEEEEPAGRGAAAAATLSDDEDAAADASAPPGRRRTTPRARAAAQAKAAKVTAAAGAGGGGGEEPLDTVWCKDVRGGGRVKMHE